MISTWEVAGGGGGGKLNNAMGEKVPDQLQSFIENQKLKDSSASEGMEEKKKQDSYLKVISRRWRIGKSTSRSIEQVKKMGKGAKKT